MKKIIFIICIYFSTFCAMKAPTIEVRQSINMENKNICNYEFKRKVGIILKTIRIIESNGNYFIRGKCGEIGAYQIMPSTWNLWSYEFYGRILDYSKENQDSLAFKKIEQLIEKGFNIREIAFIWNSGTTSPSRLKGINKYGIYFDVINYVQKFEKTYYELLNKFQRNMKEIKYKSKGNYENIILAEQIKEENEFIIIFKEEKQ